MTLTYFCDTPDLSLPDKERIKIRTYTTEVPSSIDFTAPYKLHFKNHADGSISTKQSFEGGFHELLDLTRKSTGLDISPMMAMSYVRSHYVLPDNEDIRVTVDENIVFHRVEYSQLTAFYTYDTIFLEIKFNPDSVEMSTLVENILMTIDYQEAESKKTIMYNMYKKSS